MNSEQLLPYVDPNVKSAGFVKGIRYVQKLLNDHNPALNIYTVTNEELHEVILQKRTKYGQPLASNSINYIISIARRCNPDIILTQNDFPKHKVVTNYTADDELCIQKTILFFIDILKLDLTEEYIKNNRVLIDTAIAILLCVSSNLRSSEIAQMTVQNYEQILNCQPVSIRIKKRAQSSIILANTAMLLRFHEVLMFIVRMRKSQKLIASTIVAINSKFRKILFTICESNDKKLNIDKFGIHCVRKINTTIIIANTNDLEVAKLFNRHKSTATTQFYNTENFKTTKINKIFQDME